MASQSDSIVILLEKFRREADRQNAVVLRQLGKSYAALYKRLSARIELEARRIFEQGGEEVTRVWIRSRLVDLRDMVADELRKYSDYVETTLYSNTDEMLQLGGRQALTLMRASTLGKKSLIGIDFKTLNSEQINTLIGFLSTGSPLRRRIAEMSGYFTGRIIDELVDAIALGYNPYKTARNIAPFLSNVMLTAKDGFSSVLAAAVRLTRTAQLWTYREAARANYQANSDVVSGWQWNASLDMTTCPSCLAMHGTIHPLDEPLDDHYHGRCYPTPVVLGRAMIPETSGRDYFDSLTDAQKRDVLGRGAFEAWQAGKFDFADLTKQVEDDVYGTMRVVPSLKELVGGE